MSELCPAEEQLRKLLTESLDGAEADDLAQHLEACAHCQQELGRLTADADGLGKKVRSGAALSPLPEAGEAFVRWLKRATARLSSADDSSAPTVYDNLPTPVPGEPLPVVAGYEILQEVGRGGMGVIYKARQTGLNRIVALKMLRAGAQASAADLARFRTESEAVARLQHRHILRVYDCGEAEGRPYLALEFIDTGSLKDHLDGTPWSAPAAARLIETLSRAMSVPHKHGIIHRDLKPSNILLASEDGAAGPPRHSRRGMKAPSGPARLCDGLGLERYTPKIADFGLAKIPDGATGRSGGAYRTQAGSILGTPSYMAPEQAAGRPVSEAADVYALGAILYELLAGRPPFTADTPLDILLQVLHDEPVSVKRLRPTVPRDLATITQKCLDKEPSRRYAGALDLADDLRRYQDGQPIKARPVGVVERVVKWARRRPAVAVLSAAVALVSAVGIGLVTWRWREEAGARVEAQQHAAAEAQARRETERLLVSAELDKATTVCERGDLTWGLLSLAHSLQTAAQVDAPDLERVIRTNLAGWRRFFVVPQATLPHADWVWDVAFSPDSHTILTGSKDKTARLWDAVTGQPSGPTLQHEYPVWAVAFSPDGRTLLTGCGTDDGLHGAAQLWDAATGQALGPPLATEGTVGTVAFSADGARILTLNRKGAQIWPVPGHAGDVPSGAERPAPLVLPHPGSVAMALFSPDGRTVLTGGTDGSARLWDAATGKATGLMLGHPGAVVAAAFRPDGRTVATGCLVCDAEKKQCVGGGCRLWDVDGCKPLGHVMAHPGPLKGMVFSPDGRTLLTACVALPPEGTKGEFKGEARLWDAETTEPFGLPVAHAKPVWAVAFSPDGRTFLTGCEDGFARLWLTATQASIDLPGNYHAGTVRALTFSPDGHLIVTGSAGDRARAHVWTAPAAPAAGAAIPQLAVAVSPDGKTLLGRSAKGIQLWDLTTRKPRAALPPGEGLVTAAFNPDGQTLITVRGQRVEFRNAVTGQPCAPSWERVGARLLFPDPDGQTLWIATGEHGPDVAQRWQLATDKPVGEPLQLPGHPALALSDDGRQLLAGGSEGVQLWEASTGKPIAHNAEREEWISTVAFSPGGRMFLTAGRSETAQLWESATGIPIGPPLPHPGGVSTAAFSQDGRTLVTGSRGGTTLLWDVTTGKRLGPPLPHCGGVLLVGFLAGGKQVFTSQELHPGDTEGVTAYWDVPEPWVGEPEWVLLELQVLSGMELDEGGALRRLPTDELQQRRRRLSSGDKPHHGQRDPG
jgi:WD40 repeat protein/serine/threonine protein kinase